MPIVALPAHFDGKHICLDEPFELEANAKLIITILPKQEMEDEHSEWTILSGQQLERAYGEHEPEYKKSMIQEENPDYERR